MTFRWDTGTQSFVQVTNTWAYTTQNACAGDPQHDAIGVYLEVKHQAITGILFQSLTLNEHTVMSLEPVPVTSGCR